MDLAWTQNPGYVTLAIGAAVALIVAVNRWMGAYLRSWQPTLAHDGERHERLPDPPPAVVQEVVRAADGIRKESPVSESVSPVQTHVAVVLGRRARLAPISSWMPRVQAEPQRIPHTLVIGPTRAGKTVMAQALVTERPGRVIVLDPKPGPGKWGGLPFVTIDDDLGFERLEVACSGLLAELKRRMLVLKAGKADTLEELTIVLDEAPWVVDECPSAKKVFKRIGHVGAELRMRMVVLTQSARVKALGIEGEGDIRRNYAMIYLGDDAVDVRPEIADVVRPAVMEVRKQFVPIDVTGLLDLAARPVPPDRWFALAELTEYDQQQGAQAAADTTFQAQLVAAGSQVPGSANGADSGPIPAPTPGTGTRASTPEPRQQKAEPLSDTLLAADVVRNQRDALIRHLVRSGTRRNRLVALLGCRREDALAIIRLALADAGMTIAEDDTGE